ncbi:MAG TPA: ATP-binding protein [Usitatibacter sp.]|nr:ATP-binding protein [Usitatibacter sp.]
MKLRTRLFLLVAGTVVPLVALAVVLSILLVDHERETLQRGALDRNRAFMTAVDTEINGHITSLQALATSERLEAGDIAGFGREAVRVLASQSGWQDVVLASVDGTRLFDVRAHDELAAPLEDHSSIARAISTLAPATGNVVYRPQVRNYGVAIRYPVVIAGTVRYVLSAVVDPLAFERLIQMQDLPSGWVSGLVDRSGHFVARVPRRGNAEMASKDFIAAVAHAPEGWYRGHTVEGEDTFTAFRVSSLTGWSIGLAMPPATIYSSAGRVAWALALGTLSTLLIALAVALWLSRRIARPISDLAAAARALGREPESVRIDSVGDIEEVGELARALNEAAAGIREREALRTRERVALREADRAKDEFLAMLGHELRNPLSAITTSVQVMRSAPAGSGIETQARAIIERQSSQMTRLIEDLLDISRLSMGKVRLHPEAFDVEQLVRRLVQTWEQSRRIEPGRISVLTEPVWVRADRARIEQVFANLLDNATKFTPPDRVIAVEVRHDAGDAVLEVRDQGAGIAPEMLNEVFRLFVQAPQGPDRTRGGLGLGLAVVRRLVELHGGSVRAASAGPNLGSTFTVRLPAVEPVVSAIQPQAPAAPRELRILVIEDNDDGREMLRTMLELHGHEVRAASTGVEGIKEARRWLPDVVLLDVGLPDLDGYEVARRLRAERAMVQAKLVAITGYGQSEDEQRAYRAGIDVHMTKPVEPQELLRILAQGVRQKTDEPSAAASGS